MTLFNELTRRKVFKVGAAYLVVAWLAVQAASIAFPAFEAPGWALRIFILIALLGFPISLVFAWAFDMTPDGLKPETGSRSSKIIFAIVGVLVVLAFAWYFKGQPSYREPVETDAQTTKSNAANTNVVIGKNSIAVMPFVNMSSDKEQEYFSDGMTEEILNALANVPNLAVTARTSVFSLKGQNKDVREIGKLLGVAYVLEGSVRKAGDEVRITAQLIRTDNGFHLWSETYDRKLENVFDLQAELAGAIAKALELPLGLGGDAALVSERSADPQAYALYLQARAAYRARGDGVKKSIELYREALKRDPKFAPAWAGLASSLVVLPWYVPEAEKAAAAAAMPEAEAAGKQALALSPNLPQAHNALAMVYSFQWQWALAEQHFKQALAIAPTDPDVHFQYADWLGAVGLSDESLVSASKAVELDPLVPIFLNGKANALLRLGRLDEAIEVRQVAYALAPELQMTTGNLFSTYMLAGRLDEAEKLLDETRASELARAARDPASDPKKDVQRIRRAWIRLLRDPTQAQAIRNELDDEDYARLQDRMSDDINARFKNIEAALDKHVNGVDPVGQLRSNRFADYRKDPRYIKLLNKAGFDDEGNIR
jgi:TolB-like protein/Flp pilus assembly protein TadD